MDLTFVINSAEFAASLGQFGQDVMDSCDQALGQLAEDVHQAIAAAVPVDTGALRASGTPPRQLGPGQWEVWSSDLAYAMAVEYGSVPGSRPWPHPGPKTVLGGGGSFPEPLTPAAGNIYSSQAPSGFVRASLAQFAGRMQDAILGAVQRAWGATAPLGPGADLGGIFGIDIVGSTGGTAALPPLAQQVLGQLRRTSRPRRR